MSHRRSLALLVVAATLVFPGAVAATTNGITHPTSRLAAGPVAPAAPIATDRVVVSFRDAAAASASARTHGARVLAGAGATNGSERSTMARGGASVLHTNGRPVADLLEELRGDPAIEWAEPDYLVTLPDDAPDAGAGDPGSVAAIGTDDPRLAEQYSLARMRVPDAWAITRGGRSLVAVLDTGVQWSHPDLAGTTAINPGEYGSGKQSNARDDDGNGLVDDWRGWDFVSDDNDPRDDNGHGTWVSGIIGAVADNGTGIAGISWTNPLLPVKVMSANGTGVPRATSHSGSTTR